MKITTQFVADLFMVRTQTIVNWVNKGRIKCSRIGSGPRTFTKENLFDFIKNENINTDSISKEVWEKLKTH